jgi:hypothetical protein
MDNELAVLIVEDKGLAKELFNKYCEQGKITYAAIFGQEKREQITTALDGI